MVDKVCRRYDACPVEPAPEYKHFVQHIMRKNQNEPEENWKSALAGTRYTPFSALPELSYTPAADTTLEHFCPPVPKIKGVTRTVLLRGAWALIMNRFHDAQDAVFGTIVSGRHEPFAGIRSLMGPTIATIPVRVRVDGGHGVLKYLETMEEQVRSTSSFDQCGLHRIAKVSSDARQACSFQTLLVVQPGEESHVIKSHVGDWKRLETDVGRSSYALTIQCFLNKTGIRMVVIFDSKVFDSLRAQKMLEKFSFVTQQLAASCPSRSVADVAAAVSPLDLKDIWGWNDAVPAAEETCVHDLVSQTANAQPDAPAVCAWDGSFTYKEVDVLSTRLARHLVNQKLAPESMVPLF